MMDEYLHSKLIEPINSLPFSSRTQRLLVRHGGQTVADLLSLHERDILDIAGVGPGTLVEIRSVMQDYLLPLGMCALFYWH